VLVAHAGARRESFRPAVEQHLRRLDEADLGALHAMREQALHLRLRRRAEQRGEGAETDRCRDQTVMAVEGPAAVHGICPEAVENAGESVILRAVA